MGKTMLEKILAAHAGGDVAPGEIVDVEIDVRAARDFGGANVVKNIRENDLGVADPAKTYFTFDCNPGGSDQKYATNQQHCRLFAREHGVAQVPEDELITDNRRREFEKLRTKGSEAPANKFGTIGVVAIDRTGNLAAATSTGGMTGKPAGRVGDSPLIGAGTWADNGNCAVSCTGNGEDFIRTALARTAAALVELQGLDARDAAAKALDYLAKKVNGRGGLILIDRAGHCAAAFNTPRMIHGWIEHGGETRCRL